MRKEDVSKYYECELTMSEAKSDRDAELESDPKTLRLDDFDYEKYQSSSECSLSLACSDVNAAMTARSCSRPGGVCNPGCTCRTDPCCPTAGSTGDYFYAIGTDG